jgi:hypothetical protein
MGIYPYFQCGTIGTIAYALGKTPTFSYRICVAHLREIVALHKSM